LQGRTLKHRKKRRGVDMDGNLDDERGRERVKDVGGGVERFRGEGSRGTEERRRGKEKEAAGENEENNMMEEESDNKK
jgi:hypothetical protein